jgi:hypothetical protein
VKLVCARPSCSKTFKRLKSQINKTKFSYCSQSCAAKANNAIRIKIRKAKGIKTLKEREKICANSKCSKIFHGDRKYCSSSCIPIPKSKYTKRIIITEISQFVKKQGRLPLKKELMILYRPARQLFGTWNNAIEAAGLKPNPVMFAKKHIAKDGHKCDSLAEKIIDDWFYARKINHKINVSYPGNHKLTVDFVIGDYWVEFFGLSGKHKRYDELKEKKLKLAEKHKIKLVAIYPEHLFPKNKLSEILAIALN